MDVKQNLGIWGFAGKKKKKKQLLQGAKFPGGERELGEERPRGDSGGEEGAMPPQRALTRLSSVASPVPSAAPGLHSPGAPASPGSCSWNRPGAAARAGRRRSRDCPGSRGLPGAQGTHTEPFRPPWAGNRSSKSIPRVLQGPSGCSASAAGAPLPLPWGCGTRRENPERNPERNSGTLRGPPPCPAATGRPMRG